MYLDINTPLDEWVSGIKEFKPNMIIGYPSAIKILAELAEKGDVDLHILRVVSCGEPLGASLRKYLEDIFKTEVINFYGASESLSLGVESDPQEGMLLFDDMNIVEIENGVTVSYTHLDVYKRQDKCYPLVEWGMTEQDCLNYCYERGFDWGGLYRIFHRVSCWCCPLQSLEELRKLYHHFPDLWRQLEEWDNSTWRTFLKNYSVRQLAARFDFEDQWLATGGNIRSRAFHKAMRDEISRLGKEA